MKLFCGVDEAGRGPVVGPMVMAAAVFNQKGLDQLAELKVRDSKKISVKRRTHLEPLVKELAVEYKVVHLKPADIDRLRKSSSLNQIEAELTAKILLQLTSKISKTTVDACDSIAKNYGKRITDYIKKENPKFKFKEFISENGADDKYIEVGAASILAKVERDRVVENLKKKYGDFGSGYPSDPQAQLWLKSFRGKPLPSIVRKSWGTVKKAQQASLSEY